MEIEKMKYESVLHSFVVDIFVVGHTKRMLCLNILEFMTILCNLTFVHFRHLLRNNESAMLWKIFVSKFLAASVHHCPPYSIHILYLNERTDESENEAKPNPNPLTEREMSKTQQFVPYHQMVKIDLLSFSICLGLGKFFLSAPLNQIEPSKYQPIKANGKK